METRTVASPCGHDQDLVVVVGEEANFLDSLPSENQLYSVSYQVALVEEPTVGDY